MVLESKVKVKYSEDRIYGLHRQLHCQCLSGLLIFVTIIAFPI